jgi:hypothetical protein
MDYKYDVFLSYTRSAPVGPWVAERFLPLFRGWLREELPYEPHIFVDVEGIETGTPWPGALRFAL